MRGRRTKNRLIQDTDEFELINWIRGRVKNFSDTLTGIGDDVAEIKFCEGKNLIVTTDCIQEGIHFILNSAPPELIGKKFLRVNLSDIAASGGSARWCVITLGLNRRLTLSWFKDFMHGFLRDAKKYNVNLVGGDIVESPGGSYFSLTLFGSIPDGMLVRRGSASPGDRIFVTGTLGDSALGLKVLKQFGELSRVPKKFKWFTTRHLLPTPRIVAGDLLSREKIASAMIDVSDGFLQDLSHILDESSCGCTIYADRIPISDKYCKYWKFFSRDFWSPALSGGEDYELIFTVPEHRMDRFLKIKNSIKTRITEIGTINRNSAERVIIINGEKRRLTPEGFKHFYN